MPRVCMYGYTTHVDPMYIHGEPACQDAASDSWRILEDYRMFLASRSQETTLATEAVRNRWRNEVLYPKNTLIATA